MNSRNLSWINYPIFISSTFRDMDYERDAIKFNVIPRLNERYRQHHVQFQAIDLRIGVNTEQLDESKREDYVLDVCLSKIDQARPFFIGLLGNRYGWIPSSERWQMVVDRLSEQKRPLLNGSQGSSVTEMEILYGAIGGNGQYMNRSIFMLRSPSSYSSMPEDIKREYSEDDSPERHSEPPHSVGQRLQQLKKRIIALATEKHLDNNVCSYELRWNTEKGGFDSLKPFSELLYARLCEEIDKELETAPEEIHTWVGQDTQNAESMASLLTEGSIKTAATRHVLSQMSNGRRQFLITGKAGTGKTVLAAQCWEHLSAAGFHCCLGWIGLSEHSRQMRPIIVRWILQLGGEKELTEEKLMNEEETSDAQLYSILHDCTRIAASKGEKVCFVLDGVDQLAEYKLDDLYQVWIHSDMFVILTAHERTIPIVTKYHPDFEIVTLSLLDKGDKQRMLEHKERQNSMNLPLSVHQHLLSRPLTCLHLELLMLLFCQLSISDFRHIRNTKEGSEMAKINQYLEQLYLSAPQDIAPLIRYVLHVLIQRMQLPSSYERLLTMIAASQCGIRESDIEAMMGPDWDMLQFHSLTYILGNLLYSDHFRRHWKIRSQTIREAFLPQNSQDIYHELARHFLSLPDDDYLKRETLVYFLIESEDYSLGRDYLGSYQKYNDDQDMKTWLKVSTTLLLSDPSRLHHLKVLVNQMQPVQAVTFVYYLITHGIDDHSKWQEALAWTEILLTDIQPEELDRRSAYQMGMLFLSAQSNESHASRFGERRRKFLQKALDAFAYCYTTDPESHNVRDMYSLALMEMVDFAMEDGNFELSEKLMKQAYSIT